MKLTQEDIVEIIKLFEQSKFDVCQLEIGELKLTLSNESRLEMRRVPVVASPLQAESSSPSPTTPAEQLPPALDTSAAGGGVLQAASIQAEQGLVAITAPVIGTFYEASEPGAKRFVDVGVSIEEDTTVGLIEVMKVFNTVKAGVRGRVDRVLVTNGDFVEFGQRLFMVRPH